MQGACTSHRPPQSMLCTPNDSGVHVLSTGSICRYHMHQRWRLQPPWAFFGGWLPVAGWPLFQATLRPHSKLTHRVCVPVACALHYGYMEQNFSEQRLQRAGWHENTHRVDVAEWPNGGWRRLWATLRHNQKLAHCLNHSGGDNHHERAVRCGDLTSLLERHFCVPIPIHHWIGRLGATKVPVVAFTCALMVRERRRPVRELLHVGTSA